MLYKKVLRMLFPANAIDFLSKHFGFQKKINKIRKEIIVYLEQQNRAEFTEIIDFLKDTMNDNICIPYKFINNYKNQNITVLRDEDGFPYVLHNGKRLFGKKAMSDVQMANYYTVLLQEQDMQSPHRYLYANRMPENDSVVADIGAAEGNFSLDVIDFVKKVYLFECDDSWVAALQKTFAPWMHKVEIVHTYIGKTAGDDTVSLDDFFADREIDFIKADIEGSEEDMLMGGGIVLKSKVKRLLLCCYHRQTAENFFRRVLSECGFDRIETNDGYIIWTWGESAIPSSPLLPPYLRHGVLYAQK